MVESYDSQSKEPYRDTPNPTLTGYTPAGQGPSGGQTDAARHVAAKAGEQAAAVRDTAAEATSDVVQNAKDEAAVVINEAKTQGRRLYRESMAEMRTQVETGQARLAELVRSLADELQPMVAAGDRSGPVTQVAETLQDAGERAASWLESRGPEDAMADLRRYAARNPVAFLAAAAGVGFVGSRLVRSLKDVAAEASQSPYRPVTTGQAYLAEDVAMTDYNTLGRRDEPWPATQPEGWSAARPASSWDQTARPIDDLEDPNR